MTHASWVAKNCREHGREKTLFRDIAIDVSTGPTRFLKHAQSTRSPITPLIRLARAPESQRGLPRTSRRALTPPRAAKTILAARPRSRHPARRKAHIGIDVYTHALLACRPHRESGNGMDTAESAPPPLCVRAEGCEDAKGRAAQQPGEGAHRSGGEDAVKRIDLWGV